MSLVFRAAQVAVIVSVAVATAPSTLALAADPALDETVVTATRTAVALDELIAPLFVIDREEIERSLAPDAGELLRAHAGIELARTGGPGQQTSMFTRGTDSNHTVVLIDGVRVNPGTIGSAALQNIAPESVQRIEVVKGPRSTLYGSDAIGGVVNVRTRAAAQRGLTGYLSGGRYETVNGGLAGGWRIGQSAGLGFGVDYRESAGFPTLVGDTTDRGFENLTVNLAAEYSPAATLDLRARAWRAAGNSAYTTTVFDPVTFASSLAAVDQDFENASYAIESLWRARSNVDVRATLTRIEDEIEQQQNNAGVAAPPYDFLRTARDGLELQGDIRLGDTNELTLGALLTREDTEALSYGTAFDIGTDVNQFFVQDRAVFGRQSLVAAVGLVDHETFGEELVWNAEYGFLLPTATRVTLAAGRAFRAPDSTDRYGFGGNPDLEPEVSEQIEIGLRQAIGTRHSLYANAFRNDIDALVVFVFDPVTFDGRNENVERARIEGVELGYAFRGEKWQARAEATLQDPRNRDTGERLLRRARENYVLALERVGARFSFGVDVSHAGDRHDTAFPATVTLDSYVLVNASARFALSDSWSVQARLANAFDEGYTLVNGYNTAGRSLTLATRFTFK
ncbi:MAG TPA: TonB-dependent receptor [Steroidobacteraceae bacterium]|nr:TonB-dependent receptor [Steroidobacteraceae bacterium]